MEFSEDIALAVCAYVSLGLSLRKIEFIDGMPTKSEVMMQGEGCKAADDLTNPKATAASFRHVPRFSVIYPLSQGSGR